MGGRKEGGRKGGREGGSDGGRGGVWVGERVRGGKEGGREEVTEGRREGEQALIQDQIFTSPSSRTVDTQRRRRTDIITCIL